jgi:hypothetical protein
LELLVVTSVARLRKTNSNAEEKMTATVRAPIQPNQLCDRCSAMAKVRATFLSGELHFCGHHAKNLKDSLVLKALEVYDPEAVFNL